MKYKLINSVTKIETICDKVTIDGFDYYVSDQIINEDEYFLLGDKIIQNCSLLTDEWCKSKQPKVIATNNPNIDVPKVADEVESLGNVFSNGFQLLLPLIQVKCLNQGFQAGYNKSQETHPFSEEDIIEFAEWCENLQKDNKEIRRSNPSITTKELLQLWKEQKPKIVYYG